MSLDFAVDLQYRELFSKYEFDYDKLTNRDLEIICPSCETWYTVKNVPITKDKLDENNEYIFGYYCDCHNMITECNKVTDDGSRMTPWEDEFNATMIKIADKQIEKMKSVLEDLDIKYFASVAENEPYSKTSEAIKDLDNTLDTIVEASVLIRR